MPFVQTEVVVIGGGATGVGVVRDLAMRGFKTVLVEKGDLTAGTTGRYHGLLHSGGRYAVKDPQAARECIEENRILRHIMPHCIEDTGGFFALTPWDDAEYAHRFQVGCQKAGIPVEEISIHQMLHEEPYLNPQITRCYRVPDGSADSFLATDANAASARQYGAQILNYHKVTALLKEKETIVGIMCQDLVKDEELEIHADLVVNASGAWAGQIAALAGLKVRVVPGKGTMLAMNHRMVNTVINRCKMPSDGDILVPAHTVAIIGTTDVKVDDPDHFAIQPWEVHLMLEEGEKLVPGFKQMRVLRAWAGVRPLYQESTVSDTRDVTRAFVLLDHDQRDGVAGIITITSGKWTTYRKMAEVTVDLACKKLGTSRPCRTHQEPLPSVKGPPGHYLGERLAEVEKEKSFGKLVCECELASYDEVIQAITVGQAKTIDDVRRDVRLGMGPCQGGFCTYRVAGILHRLIHPAVEATNVALRDFLQERWKGLLPILWGQQLRQERLDELVYLSLLNASHLPGPPSSRLGPELYDIPDAPPSPLMREEPGVTPGPPPSLSQSEKPEVRADVPLSLLDRENSGTRGKTVDVLVVGAGLAGLTAAWQAARRGKRVRVIAKGWGALYYHAGCMDVLGNYSSSQTQQVRSPQEVLPDLFQAEPKHPYALAGLETIQQALEEFQELCRQAGYPMPGSLEQNWLLPSALGTFRPTCLAPEMMIAGDLSQHGAMVLIGFEGFPDFYPELIADNLTAQGIPSAGLTLDIPVLKQRAFVTGRVLAEMFDQPQFIDQVVMELKTSFRNLSGFTPERIGFPAVLGIAQPIQVKHRLEEAMSLPVFEIPTLPPSIPGIRLSRLLVTAIERAGGRVFDGMQAVEASFEGRSISAIWTEAAARRLPQRAKSFVLATGGLLGGGLVAEYTGISLGRVREMVCDLPILAPADRSQWLRREFLTPFGHPIYQAGIETNPYLQPVGVDGQALYDNLYAAGASLAHGDYLFERSLDGVALVTGYMAGKNIE